MSWWEWAMWLVWCTVLLHSWLKKEWVWATAAVFWLAVMYADANVPLWPYTQ